MQIISAPSGPGSLRIDLRCDLHEVRPAADVFRDFLSGAGWPQADLMDCELAFVEACNNAIEYADPNAAEQPVTVEAAVKPAELELRITDHTPCHTGLRCAICMFGCRDSGSHFHAKIALMKHRQAASIPGHCCPQYVANDPITGPSIVPTFVPAESHPNDRARSAGGTVSLTYAWRTPVVPPPSPWTILHRNKRPMAFANPNTKKAIVDADRPINNAGRRP